MTSSVGYWLYCAIPPVHLIHPSIARATGWLLLIWAQQHQQQHSLVQYRSNGMDGGFGVCLFAHLILFYTCCSSLHNNKPPPRSTHKFTPRCDLNELRDTVEYVCGSGLVCSLVEFCLADLINGPFASASGQCLSRLRLIIILYSFWG